MNESQTQNFEFGKFRVDADKRLLLENGGDIVPLTPKVFDLLLYLVSHSGTVIEKDELMREIWTDTIVEESNLSQNISILRRVLGEKRGEHQFIATIPGKGYKFVAEVKRSKAISAEVEEEKPSASEAIVSRLSGKNVAARPLGRKIWMVSVAAALVVFAVGSFIYYQRGPNRSDAVPVIKSLAVLPFKPIVADNRDEVLEMGMADTLIARLGGNREVIVRPLSAVRRFSGLDQDAQTAGHELGVDSVLDGSIQRRGDKIRVNVRLVGTFDGIALWSGTYDENFTDIFVVQDAIAQKVAAALVLRLSGDEEERLIKRGTENPEAYRLYLQGRYHTAKSTPQEIRQGIEFYDQAIAADPTYALAFAGKARAYSALPITSDAPPNEAFTKARAAAAKALEMDPNLAEARTILGVVEFWFEWDWTNAETDLKKAIEIDPNDPDAHRFYSVLLTVLGRHDEALAEMETALRLDPLALITNALEAQTLFYAGSDAKAAEQLNRTFQIEPKFWIARIIMARVLIRQGKFDEAIAEAEQAEEFSGGNSEAVSLMGYALAKAGRRDDAAVKLNDLRSRSGQGYLPAYNIAMIYNALGQRDEALNQLEAAFNQKDARMMLLKVEPKWDNLRSESRFVDLIKHLGLE